MEVDHRSTIEVPREERIRSGPLSVLHVAQPTTGGVARVVESYVVDQIGRGWDVSVACPPDGELANAVGVAGARQLDWQAKRGIGPSVGAEIARLRGILGNVRCDLVHLHSSKAGLVGRICVRGQTPTVFQPHGWSFWALGGATAAAARRWERFAARWTDLIVCVSEGERQAGAAVGVSGVWAIVENGVDLEAFPAATEDDRAAARRGLGLPDVPVAICVGRLQQAKGQDLLLEAWSRVTARIPEALLVLVGDGPALESLMRRATRGVRFAGAHSDVRPWLAAADVVVAPSRWEAGCPLAVVEALATGRSVVATEVAGVRRALAEGVGAVVPRGDVVALADALVARLSDPVLAATEGRAARRRAIAEYAREPKTERMAHLTRSVLERVSQ